VTFSNFSASWLNVNYFVGGMEPDDSSGVTDLVSAHTIQVQPGETVRYRLTRNPKYRKSADQLIHIRVLPVTPSWEPVETEYWMELLTHPPVTIIATGLPDRIEFLTGNGAIALIPSSDFRKRQFSHKMLEDLVAEQETAAAASELEDMSRSDASEPNK